METTNTTTNINTNTNTITKKIGNREEVYKCIALYTAGGLYKDDIIEKQHNGKNIYISRKISEKMKEQINMVREHNPNFFKKQKKTFSVPKIIKNKNNLKTQKLSFQIKNNEVKNIYYPELKGINLKELKEELLREEAEEDNASIELEENTNTNKVKKPLEPFKIEELEDIDINCL
jgi:hypothetical protein